MSIGTVITGVGRNPDEEYQRHHLYKYVEHECGDDCEEMLRVTEGAACVQPPDLLPMCSWGWNRSDGFGFSIFRGLTASRGECKICRKNVDAGKPPSKPHYRLTKWI